MITLNLSGGLGNQMFQYASGLALAKHNSTALKLDLSEFLHYPLRSYMLNCYKLSDEVKFNAGIKFKWLQKIKNRLPDPNKYTEPHYHYDPNFFEAKDGFSVTGYFQSENYFKAIENDIRDHFTIKENLSSSSANIEKQIKAAKHAVSLHVRRGDYVSDTKTQKVHGSASEDYYKSAVGHLIEKLGEDIHFFIFSDDTQYAQSNFDFCQQKTIVSGNDDAPHEDMYLMSQCHHNILANSSFSWWGAWLNEHKDKNVIAPAQWFSAETLKEKSIADLFPKDWIII
ncbi:MAG: alpha-1,2-fucosyltransferase [Bdellovibrionales bacterium]